MELWQHPDLARRWPRQLPVNLNAQAFANVVKPDDAATADWTLRFQVQFLFPK